MIKQLVHVLQLEKKKLNFHPGLADSKANVLPHYSSTFFQEQHGGGSRHGLNREKGGRKQAARRACSPTLGYTHCYSLFPVSSVLLQAFEGQGEECSVRGPESRWGLVLEKAAVPMRLAGPGQGVKASPPPHSSKIQRQFSRMIGKLSSRPVTAVTLTQSLLGLHFLIYKTWEDQMRSVFPKVEPLTLHGA